MRYSTHRAQLGCAVARKFAVAAVDIPAHIAALVDIAGIDKCPAADRAAATHHDPSMADLNCIGIDIERFEGAAGSKDQLGMKCTSTLIKFEVEIERIWESFPGGQERNHNFWLQIM